MFWATARVQPTQVRRSRLGACHLFEDSPSFSTTRTFTMSNGTRAVAATTPSSADVGSNDEHSRWPVTEMMVCFNLQFGCA